MGNVTDSFHLQCFIPSKMHTYYVKISLPDINYTIYRFITSGSNFLHDWKVLHHMQFAHLSVLLCRSFPNRNQGHWDELFFSIFKNRISTGILHGSPGMLFFSQINLKLFMLEGAFHKICLTYSWKADQKLVQN